MYYAVVHANSQVENKVPNDVRDKLVFRIGTIDPPNLILKISIQSVVKLPKLDRLRNHE